MDVEVVYDVYGSFESSCVVVERCFYFMSIKGIVNLGCIVVI